MKENQLSTIKIIYEIIFDVLSIYDDILKEVMGTYFNKETSKKDLLTKMQEMLKSTKVILTETDNIISSISEPLSEVEEGDILNDESDFFGELKEEVFSRIISLVKDSNEVMDILIAYVIKTSQKEDLLMKKLFDSKEVYRNVEKLILKDEKVLYEQLINMIRTNIKNIGVLVEDLSKINFN